MTTTITTSLITSDATGHWASRDAFELSWWWVTWLPKAQVCDRNQAITAMTLAELATGGVDPAGPEWPLVVDLAAELNLSAGEALRLASRPLKPAPEGWRTVPGGQAQSPVTGRWQWIAEGTGWARERQARELAR